MAYRHLRPRRRRNAADGSVERSGDLSQVSERIAGLIDGPVTEALAGLLTALYGEALTRIVATVGDAPGGEAILDRLCDDKLVGGLLVVHDLHPHSLPMRVERALAGWSRTDRETPPAALDRIEDDVVYVRLGPGASPIAQAQIARAIAAAAPEISRVCAGADATEGFAPHP